MTSWKRAILDSTVSGAVASVATAAAAAVFGKAERGSAVEPINAVSHVVWGDGEAPPRTVSARRTLVGLAVNHAAAMFWAAVYEKLVGPAPNARKALLGGMAVSTLAYVTDYYLVPRRLTPGYEKSLSLRSLLGVYAALAVSLGTSTLLRRTTGVPARRTSPALAWRGRYG